MVEWSGFRMLCFLAVPPGVNNRAGDESSQELAVVSAGCCCPVNSCPVITHAFSGSRIRGDGATHPRVGFFLDRLGVGVKLLW